MSLRFAVAGVVLSVVVASSGCRTSSAGGRSRDRHIETSTIVDLRSEPGPELSDGVYERAVSLATSSEGKAKALIALGRVQLEGNRVESALKNFYAARRLEYHGALACTINASLGDAYMAAGDYALAGRYLVKAAEDSSGAARDVAYAKLVVVSRALNDLASATRYRGKLSQPIAPEVRQILDRGVRFDVPDVAEPDDDDNELASGTPASPPQPAAERPSLRVYSRTSWNARSPRKNIEPMGRVDKITVHHSGGDDVWSSSESDTAEEIRKIQRYHQNEQGWADIGYHYVIDRSGAIWQGRKLRYQGAHARGAANYGNVGVVLLGNYVHQRVSTAQKQSLERLIERLCERFSLPATSVYTHREILGGKTDCPGPALTQCVKEIRARLGQRLVAYRP